MIKSFLIALSFLILTSCHNNENFTKGPLLFSVVDFGQGNTKPVTMTIYSAKEIFVPESIVVSPKKKIYVSNIGGQPLESNGKGFISVLEDNNWNVAINNLDDPKGFQFVNSNQLMISDHPSVKLVDLANQQVIKTLTIPNVGFLNDLTKLTSSVFVLTDTGKGDAIKISLNQNNNEITSQVLIPAADINGNGINGAIFDTPTSTLYMVTSSAGGDAKQGHIWQVKLDGNFNPIAKPQQWSETIVGNGKLDGLALTANGNKLLVSDWSSSTHPASVFIFDTATKKQLAIIQGNFNNPADITLDGTYLYLPLFTDNQIAKIDLSSVL